MCSRCGSALLSGHWPLAAALCRLEAVKYLATDQPSQLEPILIGRPEMHSCIQTGVCTAQPAQRERQDSVRCW